MDRRQAYENEVLATFSRLGSRPPEISDEECEREYRAQRIFFTALISFRRDIESAAALSELRKDALGDLLNVLRDAAPDRHAWDEAISDQRRGY